MIRADPGCVANLRPGQTRPPGNDHRISQRGTDVGELAARFVDRQFRDGLLDVADPFAAGGGDALPALNRNGTAPVSLGHSARG
jgi:hypothetical protein